MGGQLLLLGFAAVVAQDVADRARTCISLLDTISDPMKLLSTASELLYHLHHLL